jgi:hypothetical protein
LGEESRGNTSPGIFIETRSLLFPGTCGRPASARYGIRSSLNHWISR